MRRTNLVFSHTALGTDWIVLRTLEETALEDCMVMDNTCIATVGESFGMVLVAHSDQACVVGSDEKRSWDGRLDLGRSFADTVRD